jgi:hypothetical protein
MKQSTELCSAGCFTFMLSRQEFAEDRVKVRHDLLLCDCSADSLQISNVIHRIQFLDVPWLDVGQAQSIEPGAAQIGIEAPVGEEFGCDWPLFPNHVADLAVNLFADDTVAEGTAEEILLDRGGTHERRWNRGCVVQDVHLIWIQVGIKRMSL